MPYNLSVFPWNEPKIRKMYYLYTYHTYHISIHTMATQFNLSFLSVFSKACDCSSHQLFCHNTSPQSVRAQIGIHRKVQKYLWVLIIYTELHERAPFTIEELGSDLDLNLTKVNLFTRLSNNKEKKRNHTRTHTKSLPRSALRRLNDHHVTPHCKGQKAKRL